MKHFLTVLFVAASGLNAQQPAAVAAPTLAQVTLDLLPAIRAGTTLGAWRKAHPADSVFRSTRADEVNLGHQCGHTTAVMLLAKGYRAQRTTYFYLPPTSDRPALPTGVSAAQLRDRCVAGATWITAGGTDAIRTAALKRDLELAMTSGLGPPMAGARFEWYGADQWREGTYRDVDGVDITIALFRDPDIPHSAVPDTVDGLFIAIMAPRSGVSTRSTATFLHDDLDDEVAGTIYDEGSVAAFRRQTGRINEAFSAARIGGRGAAVLRAAADRMAVDADSQVRPAGPDADAFVEALGGWLKASTSLPAARRAAALYVADGLLDRSWLGLSAVDTPFRHALLALGAEIPYVGGEDAGYMYSRNWLNESLRTSPGSRAGELAFLTLAEAGFGTGNSCSMFSRTVIARGEEYLRRFPASSIRGVIHLLMGAAWGDVVALAERGDDIAAMDDDEMAKFRQEELAARARAIAEFRLGYALAGDSPHARALWPDAWRLMAGLAPARTYFYCISD